MLNYLKRGGSEERTKGPSRRRRGAPSIVSRPPPAAPGAGGARSLAGARPAPPLRQREAVSTCRL